MTLTRVGQRYSSDDRAALLRRASATLQRVGYVCEMTIGSPSKTIAEAMSVAASIYSNPVAAFKDGMFLVNARFLIMTETPSKNRDRAWDMFASMLTTDTACLFLNEIAQFCDDDAADA